MGFKYLFQGCDAVFVISLQTLNVCWYIIHLFIVAYYLHFAGAFLECSFSKEREMIKLGS